MVIGIAGKTCAGKNSVVEPLEKIGFVHVDVDKLGHLALKNQKEKLFEIFGEEIRKSDGEVDRKILGTIVFSDPAQKVRLEEVVHPEMVRMVKEAIAKNENVIVNAAILFEMGLDKLCDIVFWLSAPAIVRFFRGMRRDNAKAKMMLKRIWAQRKMNPKNFSSSSDIYTIRNIGSREKTAEKIMKIIEKRK